ncbi:phosphoglucosamine mutase [Lentisphaerota bacterium WC36G]|nr:phosphoglucosamine mutase [Lentisphaerae bacterium WC36]
MQTKNRRLKISISGVRGVIGETLTPQLINDFAMAFGEYVAGGTVIVGRDSRSSGIMVEQAVLSGLRAVGCQVLLAGVIPTPTAQILVNEYNANGAIVISASHNPAEWNALKFIGGNGLFLNQHQAAELLDIYNQLDRNLVSENAYMGLRKITNSFAIHQKRIFNNIDTEAIRARNFTVAVDCCNGVGSFYSRQFLEALNCNVVEIFAERDGIFRRKPEPTAENLQKLSDTVREFKCDVGFAQDPDGDRLALVSNSGEAISEQYTLVMTTEHILAEKPGNVVANIQTTKSLEDVVKSYGCNISYSPVGEINVTEQMLKANAIIGGEGGSGGVIFPAVHPCRDSFTAMALILEMLALTTETFDDIYQSLPHYKYFSKKYQCSAVFAQKIIRMFKDEYSNEKITDIDGLRIDFTDGSWLLLRASNTEPVIRLFVEAKTQKLANSKAKAFDEKIMMILAQN